MWPPVPGMRTVGPSPGDGPRRGQQSLPHSARKSTARPPRRGALLRTGPSTGTLLSQPALSHLLTLPSSGPSQVQALPQRMEGLPAQALPLKSQIQPPGLPIFSHPMRALPATLSFQKPRVQQLLGLLPASLRLQHPQLQPCLMRAPAIPQAQGSLLLGSQRPPEPKALSLRKSQGATAQSSPQPPRPNP